MKKKKDSLADAPLPAPDMSEFLTRERANEGHKIPLYTPDGRLTAQWLRIRGVDSDEFTRTRARHTRRIADIVAMPEDAREEAILEATLDMQVALVAEWSFDIPFTPENVKKFLRDAPQIAAEVDKLASKRTFFFKNPSGSLMPSQTPSST